LARDGTQSAIRRRVQDSSALAPSPFLEWSNRLLNLAQVIGAAIVSWGVVYVAVRNHAWITGLLIMLGFSLSLTISLPLMVVAGSTILYQYDAVGLWLPMSSYILGALSLAIPDSSTMLQQTADRIEAPASVPAAATAMMPAGSFSGLSEPVLAALDWVGTARPSESREHQPYLDAAPTPAVSEAGGKHVRPATASQAS
jgi:hypothetical protein